MSDWSVRPFAHDDSDPVLRLLEAVGGFDGSVATLTRPELDLLGSHPTTEHSALWRVAYTEGGVVGVMLVRHLGTKRTRFSLAVNPAFRRQGIGRALVGELPTGRRLLVSSRGSREGAAAFLGKVGFEERHRDKRLRRDLDELPAYQLPSWASLDVDDSLDPDRYHAVSNAALDDPEPDINLVRAHLAAVKARVAYLRTPQGDQGLIFVRALDRAKRSELDETGISSVGLLSDIGLAKACRGKGLSRPLMRAGLELMQGLGFRAAEVVADGRRERAAELYKADGFEEHDTEIRWIRRDDEA
jgi:mycothiol synthase